MRSRPSPDESVAELTRRRLDALIAELAESRGEATAAAAPASESVAVPASASAPGSDPASDPASGPASAAAPAAPRQPGTARAAGQTSGGRHALRPLAGRRRVAGWVTDRLPPAMQGRAHLGSAQFGVVALVVAVGLVIGAWALVRAAGSSDGAGEVAPPRPVGAQASAPASGSGAGTTPAPATTAQTSAGEQIVVDVVGKVRHPGIAVLPAGSRVVDAVRAAGGMRPGVDPATVNMARPLTDGEQIAIGVELPAVPPSGVPASPGEEPQAGLVNLNTADQAALETLPGVGPVTAAAILEWRAEHGAFTSVDELLEVSGIGDATLAEIAPHVTL